MDQARQPNAYRPDEPATMDMNQLRRDASGAPAAPAAEVLTAPNRTAGATDEVAPAGTAPAGTAPAGTAPTQVTTQTRRGWARVGMGAVLGLIIGLSGLYAVLTGLLAPVGIALGIIGVLINAAGFAGVRRDGVTGHSLALIGMLASLAAVVLGLLAVTGSLTWLHGNADNVLRARDWLNARLPWMRNW